MSSASPEPVPMTPCLVVDPEGITQEGHTLLLDSKGERLTRSIEALWSGMSFGLTWQGGWILSSDRRDLRTFLYNAHTGNKIELPRLETECQLPRTFECALSDKPTAAKCVLVVLHPEDTCLWYCHIGAGGDDAHAWVKYDYDVGSHYRGYDANRKLIWRKIVVGHMTACQGRFYFPTTLDKLGILEFDPRPTIRVLPMRGLPQYVPPNPWGGFCCHACRFELDGEHYQFFTYYCEDPTVATSIALYRMDAARKRWCQVQGGIGDRALLWSGARGRCCPASEFGLEPNCVYRIHTKDSLMHIFSLTDKTERVCFHPSQDLPRLSSNAFWLLPTDTD